MEYDLINTIVACIVSAFIFGLLAKRFKLPVIVGYLVAGVIVGPHSPGFVADIHIAQQLAEIGVILLMFGVGLHFSTEDLLGVRKIALPGALFQMTVVTLIGTCLIKLMGFSWINAVIFGIALSPASTVVLMRTLERRKALTTEAGKIAVGWLVVEDLVMVMAIVLLPAVANITLHAQEISAGLIIGSILKVFLKIGLFAVLMIMVGRHVLPWVLVRMAKTKSRELASLGMLAVALGFAYVAYTVFDASFALGAFLAGLIINESEIGHKAVEQSLPMRDTFGVLFFVSVGMLFDPMVLIEQPLTIMIALFIIIVGNASAAMMIMRWFKYDIKTRWTISVSLAQIGEFSFIFAGMAVALKLLPPELYNIILAAALISIATNHFLFKAMDRHLAKLEAPTAT